LKFLKIFIPEAPFLLLFLLIPIEIFSYVIRALSLAIRLSANIMAGHTLVFLISGFTLNIISIKIWLFLFFSLFLFAILLLEFGVAFLQAYVFVILICIFLNDSLKPVGH
jgi:ATP synthase subunit 6